MLGCATGGISLFVESDAHFDNYLLLQWAIMLFNLYYNLAILILLMAIIM